MVGGGWGDYRQENAWPAGRTSSGHLTGASPLVVEKTPGQHRGLPGTHACLLGSAALFCGPSRIFLRLSPWERICCFYCNES